MTTRKMTASDESFVGRFLAKNKATSFEKVDLDKFKPMGNFLKRKTKSTDRTNLELIAWLIGFESRPFLNYKHSILITPNAAAIASGSNLNNEGEWPEKIQLHINGVQELRKMGDTLELGSLKQFFGAILEEHMEEGLQKWSEETLKPMVQKIIEEKFIAWEQRLERVIKIHKNFGSLGLLFVTTPDLEVLKKSIFTDFSHIMEGLESNISDDDFEDDDDEDDDDLW